MFQCSTPTENTDTPSEYPLLETMGYYQRFSQKVWLAGKNQNWDLAAFYAHELDEVTEELIRSNVIHDELNLSELAKSSIFEENIAKLDDAIDKKDQLLFRESYDLVIGSCNTCHISTNHPFIKITIPTDSTIFNQLF